MYLEFARMDVYVAALDFVVIADRVTEAAPRGHGYLRRQLREAANSIAANIAEGVGEFAALEKARFYRMARRSAVECASHILVLDRLKSGSLPDRDAALELLARIIAMLTNLGRSVRARV